MSNDWYIVKWMTEKDEGLNIIQVNDDPSQLCLLKTILEHAGHRVDSFNDPNDALKEVKRRLGMDPQGVDLIMTDGKMPDMNGGEFAARIREIPYKDHLPIILLSGTPEVFAKRYLPETVDVFVKKPFKIAAIAEAIENALEMAAKRKSFL